MAAGPSRRSVSRAWSARNWNSPPRPRRANSRCCTISGLKMRSARMVQAMLAAMVSTNQRKMRPKRLFMQRAASAGAYARAPSGKAYR